MKQHLLQMTKHGQKKDIKFGAKYLTADELAAYEVYVDSEGMFKWKKDDTLVDTSAMIAHGKPQYAAFVMHEDGRIHLFSHRMGKDNLYHSSMTSGEPVIAAGELIIKDGKLSVVNTLSGHYAPSLLATRRFLNTLRSKAVDISQASVETMMDLSEWMREIKVNEISHKITMPGGSSFLMWTYRVPATSIVQSIKALERRHTLEAVTRFDEQEKDLITAFFKKIESKLSSTYGLTHKRNILRTEVKNMLNSEEYKSKSLQEKITIVDNFLAQNSSLSQSHRTSLKSGRLHKTLTQYKSELKKLKAREDNPNDLTLEAGQKDMHRVLSRLS